MTDADHLQILRPLGADRTAFVGRDTSGRGGGRLVVVDRVTRSWPASGERAALLRRAHALAAVELPRVVAVRDVIERGDDVLVVSDYVDGEWLSDVLALKKSPPPLELLLRVLLDVLQGLTALHDLGDGRDPPLGVVHGGVSPSSILVGDDGLARVAHACRLAHVLADERYVAPEIRRGEVAIDPRTDVYAVGVMLSDALVDAPAEKKWAEPLGEVAWRGCRVELADRWPTARAMAAEVRRRVGGKIASAEDVGSFVRAHFGPHMRARRAALDVIDEMPPSTPHPPPSSGEVVSLSDVELLPSSTPALPPLPPANPPPRRPGVHSVPAQPAAAPLPVPSAPPVRAPASVLEPLAATTGAAAIAPPAPPVPAKPAGPPPVVALEDAYRRKMPTVPVIDRPPRASVGWSVLVALGVVAAFTSGLVLGRRTAPAADPPPQAACAPLPSPAAEATTAPAAAAMSMPSAAPSAVETPASEPTTLAVPTPLVASGRVVTSTPPAPRPAPAPAPAPAPRHAASAGRAHVPRPAPRPEATTPAAPSPRPASTGYVPSEL